MDFNEELQQYIYENEGLIFAWDEEPEEDIKETVDKLTKNYIQHLPDIIDFILPDLKEMYGDISIDEVKEKIGQPTIDFNNGRVTYYKQTFDLCHIFEFEFLDDAFMVLQYFSIDG